MFILGVGSSFFGWEETQGRLYRYAERRQVHVESSEAGSGTKADLGLWSDAAGTL